MKKLFILCFILLLFVSGCSSKKDHNSNEENPDILVDIADKLKNDSNDYTIDKADKNILSGERYVIHFNDDFSVQVYIYDSIEDAETDANNLSDDGRTYTKTSSDNNSITSIIDWTSGPHFYQYENTIILYIGNNQDTITQLSNSFGEQIAGD